MLSELEITKICQKICAEAGYDFNIPVKINKRLKTTLGRVFSVTSGCNDNKIYNDSMEFSYQFLLNAETCSIMEVIQHECAHYLVTEETHERHGHDAVFKAMCKRIGCTNDGSIYKNLKTNTPSEKLYKYFVICDKCGGTLMYHRAGKIVQHPEHYSCSCGGKLHVQKNF